MDYFSHKWGWMGIFEWQLYHRSLAQNSKKKFQPCFCPSSSAAEESWLLLADSSNLRVLTDLGHFDRGQEEKKTLKSGLLSSVWKAAAAVTRNAHHKQASLSAKRGQGVSAPQESVHDFSRLDQQEEWYFIMAAATTVNFTDYFWASCFKQS